MVWFEVASNPAQKPNHYSVHNDHIIIIRSVKKDSGLHFWELCLGAYFLIGCGFWFFFRILPQKETRREKGSAVFLIFFANKVWAKLTYNSFSIANFCFLCRTRCELLLNVPNTGHKWPKFEKQVFSYFEIIHYSENVQ